MGPRTDPWGTPDTSQIVPDQTSGRLHRVSGYIWIFASYTSSNMSEYIVASMIVLIMKHASFADENVGWTCLLSTERFKFDVNISMC